VRVLRAGPRISRKSHARRAQRKRNLARGLPNSEVIDERYEEKMAAFVGYHFAALHDAISRYAEPADLRRWTMRCSPAPTPPVPRGSALASVRPSSPASSTRGGRGCPIPSRPKTGRRATVMTSPSTPLAPPGDTALRPYFDKLEVAIDHWIEQAQLAA
jgi:hypothetical protein